MTPQEWPPRLVYCADCARYVLPRDLYWHCVDCGANEPVQPTGDQSAYTLGDREPCITCGDGTAHVMTLRMAACFEQGLALGLQKHAALKRAIAGGAR